MPQWSTTRPDGVPYYSEAQRDESSMTPGTERAQRFVQAIDRAGKPIAVICHGGWLLISAGLVKGHTITTWPTLQDDMRNAGAQWVDRECVRDRNWVSSRKPDDLPAFNREIAKALDEVKPGSAKRAENRDQLEVR